MQKTPEKTRIDYFKEQVYRWQAFFGLFDWEFYVDETEEEGLEADCRYNAINRCATIRYEKNWIQKKETDFMAISKAAFHECAEVYMSGMFIIIQEFRGYDEAQKQVHIPIRMLENKLFPLVYEEKK